MTEKIPISGGPHTGKSTLLEALRVRFPDAYFLPEPATIVIEDELAAKERNSNHQLRVPWVDYAAFSPLVVDQSIILEKLVPSHKKVAFQDRSLIDNIAYARLNEANHLIPPILEKIALARYSFALICEPLDIYEQTDVRQETHEQALAAHHALVTAYEESGLDIVRLAPVSVNQRVELVADALQARGIS